VSQRCAEESCGDIALFDGWCLLCAANYYRRRSTHLESLVAEAEYLADENIPAWRSWLARAHDDEGVARAHSLISENRQLYQALLASDSERGAIAASCIKAAESAALERKRAEAERDRYKKLCAHRTEMMERAEAERDWLREERDHLRSENVCPQCNLAFLEARAENGRLREGVKKAIAFLPRHHHASVARQHLRALLDEKGGDK